MTQADSVLSTPPTNTPAVHSRRGFLAQAAGVAAGGAALGMAIPLPAPAATPQGVPDPILEAIEAHKAARATWIEKSKRIRTNAPRGYGFLNKSVKSCPRSLRTLATVPSGGLRCNRDRRAARACRPYHPPKELPRPRLGRDRLTMPGVPRHRKLPPTPLRRYNSLRVKAVARVFADVF
jgi:hypothetical protein